jgi:uncharacterized protein (DUF433 family)
MARRLFTESETADIVRRIAAGETSPDIARDYGVNADTPRRIYLRATGAHFTPNGKRIRKTADNKSSVLAMAAEGASMAEIAQHLRMARRTVFRYLHPQAGRVYKAPRGRATPKPPAAPDHSNARAHLAAALARCRDLQARAPATPTERPEPAPAPPPRNYLRSAVTLDTNAAHRTVTALEKLGWRAEALTINSGVAIVEVRDLAIRSKPLIATLRTEEDVTEFFKEHPDHGLKGRVVGTTALGMRPAAHTPNTWLSPVTVGTP